MKRIGYLTGIYSAQEESPVTYNEENDTITIECKKQYYASIEYEMEPIEEFQNELVSTVKAWCIIFLSIYFWGTVVPEQAYMIEKPYFINIVTSFSVLQLIFSLIKVFIKEQYTTKFMPCLGNLLGFAMGFTLLHTQTRNIEQISMQTAKGYTIRFAVVLVVFLVARKLFSYFRIGYESNAPRK